MNFGTTEIILVLAVALLAVVVPVGILAAVVFGVLKRSKKDLAVARKCPFCAEAIQSGAVICRFCGRDVPIPVK